MGLPGPRSGDPLRGSRIQSAGRRDRRQARSAPPPAPRLSGDTRMRTLETGTSLSGRTRAALLLPIVLLGIAHGACTRRASTPKKPEQVFRFRMHEDPPTLDPALTNDEFSDSVVLNVNRGLVELDPG